MCNFFAKGSCQKAENCQAIHQYSLDYDVKLGFAHDLGFKVPVIGMEFLFVLNESAVIAVLTDSILQVFVVSQTGFQNQIVAESEKKFSCLNYEKENKFIILGFVGKNK
jgi:hypothetical protein